MLNDILGIIAGSLFGVVAAFSGFGMFTLWGKLVERGLLKAGMGANAGLVSPSPTPLKPLAAPIPLATIVPSMPPEAREDTTLEPFDRFHVILVNLSRRSVTLRCDFTGELKTIEINHAVDMEGRDTSDPDKMSVIVFQGPKELWFTYDLFQGSPNIVQRLQN